MQASYRWFFSLCSLLLLTSVLRRQSFITASVVAHQSNTLKWHRRWSPQHGHRLHSAPEAAPFRSTPLDACPFPQPDSVVAKWPHSGSTGLDASVVVHRIPLTVNKLQDCANSFKALTHLSSTILVSQLTDLTRRAPTVWTDFTTEI